MTEGRIHHLQKCHRATSLTVVVGNTIIIINAVCQGSSFKEVAIMLYFAIKISSQAN